MTESVGRRSVLGVICGIATGGAGCLSRSPLGQSETSSPSRTEASEDRDCTPTPNSDGGPPPWYDPDSSDDIVIENGTQSAIDVTLTIGDDQRELPIAAHDYWRSGDIIDDGERSTITVATQNRNARVEWEGERDNMGIAVVVFHETYIDAGFSYKFCSHFEPPSG